MASSNEIGRGRRDLAEREPWLPATVLKTFRSAKDLVFHDLFRMSAQRVSLPFLKERTRPSAALIGRGLWQYGFAEIRARLKAFSTDIVSRV